VRVLLDENLPRDLASELPGCDVDTVIGLGWAGIKNGELLRRCEARFDALVTMDSSMEFQQRVSDRPFGVIVIQARSSRMTDLLPLVPELLSVIAALQPGEVRRIGA
jgi:predicted nuclease of predicted toxin-antitoxin system